MTHLNNPPQTDRRAAFHLGGKRRRGLRELHFIISVFFVGEAFYFIFLFFSPSQHLYAQTRARFAPTRNVGRFRPGHGNGRVPQKQQRCARARSSRRPTSAKECVHARRLLNRHRKRRTPSRAAQTERLKRVERLLQTNSPRANVVGCSPICTQRKHTATKTASYKARQTFKFTKRSVRIIS